LHGRQLNLTIKKFLLADAKIIIFTFCEPAKWQRKRPKKRRDKLVFPSYQRGVFLRAHFGKIDVYNNLGYNKIMQIDIKAINLELTPIIREYIEEKIGSISRFIKRFEAESEIRIFVEIARTTRHHKSGDVFCAEARFTIGKKLLMAEHTDWDIRIAIDKVKDKLQQEIKKYKEKKIEKN